MNAIRTEDASQRAYAFIREAILADRVQAGERLKEEQLAEEIGVSRTPVREALRRLNAEGLVNLASNRSACVAPAMSDHDIEEIFVLRILLESFGASLAAMQIGADQLEEMKALGAQMERSSQAEEPDFDQIAVLNNRFHQVILESTGNHRLVALVSRVVEMTVVHRTLRRYSKVELQRSLAHHRAIIAALETRNAHWAEAVMRAHLHEARNALLDREDAPHE